MAENLLARIGISEQKVFSYPYVVHKELKNYFVQSMPDYDSEFVESLESLKNMMLKVASIERKKEDNFVRSFIYQNFTEYDSKMANDLMSVYSSSKANKISYLMDAIQKYRMKMYNCEKSIRENAQEFAKSWNKIYNKTFVDAVKNLDLHNMKPEDMTVEEIISLIEQNILDKYKETTSSAYGCFVKKVMENIRSMSGEKFGKDYKTVLKNLENNPYIQAKRKEYSGKNGKNDTPISIIQGYLFGIINGLSAETFLEANKIGTSTARITQSLKTASGKGAGAKVAIQTDVLEVLSTTFEITPPDQEETIALALKTADEMYSWLNKLDIEKHFVVHTSVKDQSTNRNYASGSMSIDVRKDASLDVRIQPLKEICEKINMGNKSMENLIFALINAGNNMISEDLYKNGKLLQGLTAVCAAYMFEDYIDTFSQLESDTNNNAIHVYFINGHYYTLSDILLMASERMSEKKSASYVQIGFKPIQKDVFAQQNLMGLQGRERWEKAREDALTGGKMNIRLNTRLLVDTVYKDL